MGLELSLLIGTSGINDITAQFGTMSQNVANANTANYAAEVPSETNLEAGGVGMGVVTGPVTLNVDNNLLAELQTESGQNAYLQTLGNALQPVSAALGTPGQGNDLGSLLTSLQNAFSALLGNPASASLQQATVQSAQSLAQGINSLAQAYGTAQQNAQNDLVAAVGELNQALARVGSLNRQITSGLAAGQSVADLQNQRNAAMQTIANLIGAHAVPEADGGILVIAPDGLVLPTSGSAFSVQNATVGPNATYPGGLPGVMLNGSDVTLQITSGRVGADLALRDQILPTYQAELDEFSETLATRFAAQGLTLFTTPSGTVPPSGGTPVQSGYVGFSQEITVNPAVLADPSLVTNGTNAVTGSPTGASAFTPNPPGGPAGFTTLIERILNYTFGADVQAGVPQPPPNTTGLGPSGTLSAPFPPPSTLGGFAGTVVAAQSNDIANIQSQASTAQAAAQSLSGSFTSRYGVNINQEMSTLVALQNAYAANARVIQAVQSMWDQFINLTSYG